MPKRKRKPKRKGGICQQSGPLLVTHKGLSGPAALRLSAFAARELAESAYRAKVAVNWCGDDVSRTALTTAEVLDEAADAAARAAAREVRLRSPRARRQPRSPRGSRGLRG